MEHTKDGGAMTSQALRNLIAAHIAPSTGGYDIDNLVAALMPYVAKIGAAAYYIDRLRVALSGRPVRDLEEAAAAYYRLAGAGSGESSFRPDVWDLIRDDPELKRARQRLSLHEIRRIIIHAQNSPRGAETRGYHGFPSQDAYDATKEAELQRAERATRPTEEQ